MKQLPEFINNISNLFVRYKKQAIFILLLLILLVGSVYFLIFRIINRETATLLQEIDLPFNPEGSYALLLPRRDGNAINLNIKRASSYEAFSYEIVYQSQGIDRGAGDPKTYIELKDKKSEYQQEILFGTCSRGDTTDLLHCVFDKDVENGTLSLRFKKGNIAYKMLTTWHLQKPDVFLGRLTSADNHFIYETEAKREDLATTGFTLINDLSGSPKLPNGKEILGKVYALSVPIAKNLAPGKVTFELNQAPSSYAQIGYYIESRNDWELLSTQAEGSKLSALANGAGIFAVLINTQK